MAFTKEPRTHSADTYAGKALRRLRQLRRLTQQQLAEKVGVTFQQMQKYETGMNRLSVSRLYMICIAIAANPLEFFEGFSERNVAELSDKEFELIKAYRAKQNVQLSVDILLLGGERS